MNVLFVGGSDPSGVSGVQRDARVAWSMGAHPLSVVTAVTAQNTSEFAGVQPVRRKMVRQQLDAVLSDFEVSAVKVGMLWSADIAGVVADSLKDVGAPMALDPVVRSTTGGALLDDSARRALLERVVPLAGIVTPNAYEAGYLTGTNVGDTGAARAAARQICEMGAAAAVVTGVASGGEVVDVLYDGRFQEMGGRRLDSGHRGGGCTFSAIIACHMAAGRAAAEAAVLARDAVRVSILESTSLGAGRRVAADPRGSELALAIDRLAAVPYVARLIPECQTNFVYAAPDSASPDQVLGIAGRMVRTGDSVVRAGMVVPGGSRHVASAVCAVRTRFPELLSAANIRYSAGVVSAMVREGFVVAFYDRGREPLDVKGSGSSVAWGVSEAASASEAAPDAVCHRGDFGKEPMTIIFGADPGEVVSKIRRISDGMRRRAPGGSPLS
ncbi:MAG: bifunctional hydroxymethylpyrimidine kinase/phosphomethylpyrimidine kinase [Nitrosopumilaceae archaeon]|nr:bifunctional hydroxymethylpyrimidine kinase/phosphomethylpyrimidine kinase [Nitrosopumilaceae archaeon]